MSRVGLKPITLPDKVSVDVKDGAVVVKGPKGELTTPVPEGISAKIEDGGLQFARADEERQTRAFHGLARSLANNAIQGVSQGFERRLAIVGVGYRAVAKGKAVEFNLGYSHPVVFNPPAGIEVAVEDQTKLVVRGIDKQQVGQVAAELRALRSPDPYKGKGVRYEDETIRLKAGKTGA
jgi:large subunit ribosomal protein L6